MEIFINAFVGFFVIVDPVGTTMIFNALTAGAPDRYRRMMAIKSIAIAVAVTIFFGLFGAQLLEALSIELNSFRIAGGLLLFHTAFLMITKPDEKSTKQRMLEEEDDISVFPLAIPLLAGPGVLTLTILLAANTEITPSSVSQLTGAMLSVFALTLLLFLFSKTIARVFGKTLNNILKRLLGVLLAALAVQFIADGINGLFG